MSGPFADQPVQLDAREIAALLYAYQFHTVEDQGLCRCEDPKCTMRSSARGRLRVGGIDPEQTS